LLLFRSRLERGEAFLFKGGFAIEEKNLNPQLVLFALQTRLLFVMQQVQADIYNFLTGY
jgi:hypothetical protein